MSRRPPEWLERLLFATCLVAYLSGLALIVYISL